MRRVGLLPTCERTQRAASQGPAVFVLRAFRFIEPVKGDCALSCGQTRVLQHGLVSYIGYRCSTVRA